ncbi:MAG: signal peptidase I [Clostridiales bacterium]|nr:signal peptidase I [Clostridiales bacterium]
MKNITAADGKTEKKNRIRIAAGRESQRGCFLWRSLLLALAGLVIGVNVWMWNAKNLVGDVMPMPFGIGVSVVLSGSMEPELSVGDLVIIRGTQTVAVGDVIVYQSGRDLIIHRVVAVSEDTVVTQGDANNVPDDPIDISDVKGKLAAHIPGVGKVVRILKKPVVIVLFLLAALLLVERSYRREREDDEETLDAIREEIRRLKEEELAADMQKEEQNPDDIRKTESTDRGPDDARETERADQSPDDARETERADQCPDDAEETEDAAEKKA